MKYFVHNLALTAFLVKTHMTIVDPRFDLAFKFLMDNEKYARKVLSVIHDQEVAEVTSGQHESVWPSPARQLSYFRPDFRNIGIGPPVCYGCFDGIAVLLLLGREGKTDVSGRNSEQ